MADDVVDDLMRVVSEALPRREEAKMIKAGPRAGQRSEIDALKAKSQAGHEPKRPKPQSQSEVDVLIRKPPRDASDVLKAKGEGEGASDLERRAASTTVALMKKLAATQGPTRAAKLREHPTRSPANGGTKRGSALRPVADPALVAARTGARAELQRECEVRWWRGHVKSQFLAVETEADGGEATVASSPSFRWRQSAPPREWPAAAAALRALVEALEREGWTIAGRGEEWFAVRFRIELDVDPTRAAAIHEAGT